MELYRITHERWSNSLSSSGRAARWNSNRVDVIYTAMSRSLACLENVVHRDISQFKDLYKIMIIYVPDSATVSSLTSAELPERWFESGESAYNKCRPFGDKWSKYNNSLLLKVPSSIVQAEFNMIINPHHIEFNKVKIVDLESFNFDYRIKK